MFFFQFLIQSSKDLMDVEPHKLVIIFVDFNNRNIILENEDTEIGDLRNDTTKMFLSLKCKYCHQWRKEISCITSCLCFMLMNFLFDMFIVETVSSCSMLVILFVLDQVMCLWCTAKTKDPRICHQIICTTPDYTPLTDILSSLS